MTRTISRTSQRNASLRLKVTALYFLALASISAVFLPVGSEAQPVSELNGFRIGERLTYSVSMGRFANAAYAELYCVSRGRLGDREAIELRAKFKTLELASAVYPLDENRTTFVSPLTGLPLRTSVIQNVFGLPKETTQNFLIAPSPHADLLTVIHKLRFSGGGGSLTMEDGEKVYSVTFQPGLAERQRTDAGEFETTVVSVQSEYFTERGITDVRVNLSTDEAKIPVLVRFRIGRDKDKEKDRITVRARLASVQTIEPEVDTQPLPAAATTPLPERTPRPAVTPTPYVGNIPLVPELTFELGERLEYKIQSGGRQVASMHLSAKERKQIDGFDTLLLEANFTNVLAGSPFAEGDYLRAYVNPETLAPRKFEMRFGGAIRAYSGVATFHNEGSAITVAGKRVDAPVGTHSVLSLLYAARSFNLKPSRDLNNPINDTRVAVLWEAQPYIFTLRPSAAEVLTMDGKQVPAQLVSVSTKNALLDQMNIKVWLGNDGSRVPVRFILGGYQADLVAATKVIPN